jgi:hypothetical protein
LERNGRGKTVILFLAGLKPRHTKNRNAKKKKRKRVVRNVVVVSWFGVLELA